jgi:large subunit ribosomal protein L21
MIAALGKQGRVTQRLASTLHQLVGAGKGRIAGRMFSFGQATSWDALEEKVSRYAVIDHGREYEEAMQGRHGAQLELAQIDGIGKDDEVYDPFNDIDADTLVDEYFNKITLDYAEEVDDGDDKEVQIDRELSKKEEFLEAEIVSEKTLGSEAGREPDEDEELDEDEKNDAIDYIDEVAEEIAMYNNDGSPRYSKSQLANFRAGFPAGGLFAVIRITNSQNKVAVDDVVIVHKLIPVVDWPIGSVHTIKDVLLVGSSHKTLVGLPNVPGAEVDVMVEEITKDEKVIIFKKKRRKNSQRKNGFRRDVVMLRVLDIRFPKDEHAHKHTERVPVAPYKDRLS